ncbi:hypothetical protein [Halalkalicoccus tibetensis]|uniref:Uncharacterized protein n=1 Tax=Halalkalicoccus tibetensis TaxID=175632 RepID=A0ABD5V4J3_9EURY
MDRTEAKQVAPHYVAVMVLVFVVVAGIDLLVDFPFWIGVVLALGIGALYRPLVLALGVAPEPWRG